MSPELLDGRRSDAADDPAITRWTAVLDELEASARRRPDAPLEAGHAAWEPPADLPPLPRVLRERASRIPRLQQLATARLTTERSSLSAHLAAIAAAAPHPSVGRPVYLDVSA